MLSTDDHSTISLSMQLVNVGITFHTLQRLSILPTVALSSPPTLIPVRVHDYVFTVDDHSAYVERRAHILSSPRGQAALLVGGLVWRLALEHLGMESVSFGPSSAVVQHGLGYLFKVPDGQIYIDDGLTQNELEVICGLYRCYTGMIVLFSFILSHLMKNLGQGKQEALLSWWPLPNKWFNHVSNGFYWGHWTELDEEWFQIRSSKISQGREQPKRPNKWRNVLKGGKSWRSTVDRHLKAAEDLYNWRTYFCFYRPC